jgi:hypothetical protein
MGAAIALQKLALAHLMKGDVTLAMNHAQQAVRASQSHGPEMRSQTQELVRKIEDSKLAAAGMAVTPNLLKTAAELAEEIPLNGRTIFPQRAATGRPASRTGRTNINGNWAAFGR